MTATLTQTPPETAKTEETIEHPLFSRELLTITTWSELVERWENATTVEEMISLLHIGFNIFNFGWDSRNRKDYQPIDRIIFYFRVADGWADHHLLRKPEDETRTKEYLVGYDSNHNQIRKSASEVRQMIAQKAFDMLCQNFFNMEICQDRLDDRFMIKWEEKVVKNPIFPIIMNFFRIQKRRNLAGEEQNVVEVRNLDHRDRFSHNQKNALTFLFTLPTFLWQWREERIEHWMDKAQKEKAAAYNAKMRALVDQAQLWMVQLLALTGKLHILYEWRLDVSKICMEALRKIALQQSYLSKYTHPVEKDRRLNNIQEAAYVGSTTAQILLQWGNDRIVHSQLTRIQEAQRASEKAKRKVREVSSPQPR